MTVGTMLNYFFVSYVFFKTPERTEYCGMMLSLISIMNFKDVFCLLFMWYVLVQIFA